MSQCPKCFLPRFRGAYGYVGEVCICLAWETRTVPPTLTPCNCIGPQNGQPLCPCQMQGVIVRDGRYIKPEQDLGPVREVKHEPR